MTPESDRKSLQHNRISKVKNFIGENWSGQTSQYAPYEYMFKNMLDDLRRDFLTGVAYYVNALGKRVPAENDIDTFRSFAVTCGLKPTNVQMHLMRFLGVLEPQWLVDVPAWDQLDRVKTLCHATEIENLSPDCFYHHVLEWGAGIFGRAADPSFQNKVLILRGDQGIGKDYFIKTLCKSLGPYFGTWTNSRNEKDIIEIMERSLVVNIPEFDNTHKNEVAMLKALITKYQATYRTPYARKADSIDLRTSFVSSANVEYILRDSTGNRRYLIFVVNKFDLMDKFSEFDSLQILAQFKHFFEVGFKVPRIHGDAMNEYIESQTPQSFENQVIEAWDNELVLYKLQPSQDGWYNMKQIGGVFDKLKKEFGIGRNHLSVILQNRGCRKRSKFGTEYRSSRHLRVMPNDAE